MGSYRSTRHGNCHQGKLWLSTALLICLGLLIPQAGLAAFSDTPIAVSTAEGKQCRPQIVYDGSGGYYVTWQDFEAEGVFAQHYDVNGDPWPAPLKVGSGSSYHQQEAVADPNGNLLVAWYDYDLGYTYVQRIDVAGNIAWAEGGVAVIDNSEPWIASDGTGGAIVMSYYGYVNRVAADGSLPWGASDNPKVYSTNSWATKIVSDGAGGAILLWEEGTVFDGIAVQRIDGSGNFVWNEGTPVRLSAEGGSPSCPRIIPNTTGGALIAWYDGSDVHAQKLNADGQIQWTAGGVVVGSSISTDDVELASDGAGGAFVTWSEWSTDTTYAGYVNTSGSTVWPSQIAITAEGDLYDVVQHPRHTIEDGQGGFITAWVNPDGEIKAQRCDASGNLLWTANGAVLATTEDMYYEPKLASNGQGGAVAVWVDYLTDSTYEDIFMQGVSAAGVAGNPGYTPPPEPTPTPVPSGGSGGGGSSGCFIETVGTVPASYPFGHLLFLLAGLGGLLLVRRS
jgi:hypothetical protein